MSFNQSIFIIRTFLCPKKFYLFCTANSNIKILKTVYIFILELRLERKDTCKINPCSVLQQTAFWSEVKLRQGISSKAFDIKAEAACFADRETDSTFVDDDFLVLFHEIGDGYQIGYLPYGPTLTPQEENQGPFLEELSESLRPHLPKKCIMLRYDLLWESYWTQNNQHNGHQAVHSCPPARESQELRFNFNTQNWNLKKSYTNNLPSDTLFIDLKKNEYQLLREMKPKTRYNTRLANKKGVVVEKTGFENLDIWYHLYRDTCKRNHIFLHDMHYFQTMLATSLSHTGQHVDVELLLASHNQQPLAAMFLVYSGKRATYLYGASSSKNRNLMATYALQWEAMKRAKRRGCTEYDMFGISPSPEPSHPLYGLYKFKTGFGGNQHHRLGCWDYPFDGKSYEMYTIAEMNSSGYHL
jgi:lipid II:glycine glycyltransferase (peptidoglycan interpeptide bridge formation enzyme)